ncbi:glutamate 5-kinase [Arthrobacter sp. Hiyo8]|uniref:Glutamate 5-kinase n=2 Tax=Arthrobacter TaxID=1663 RepID=A0AAW8DF30_9MICC|nr:glutamate 5-kinase [Arthrobacter bambusae]BAS17760.1 glutamate 5-kinase [Arthrobacter sp. Hiyo8]MDP9903895.1 glutamate 5-kinase [Arthrobacter bambusae]MDQ0128109.1 glutamate 5-kinase [Arthrobacter bambusae]MDQ0179451.1 glutamate 5-kinase [Arthrobacter bambusae]MDQ0241747.1 glutamate 5-kinase [Arthrobacter bambusae]
MTTSTARIAEVTEGDDAAERQALAGAKRIVVKVGSSSLTSIKGGISEKALTALVHALAEKRNSGTEIILVSSGAIAAGLAPLGLAKRPKDLATQQAAASVGQGLLMARYSQAFAAHGVTVSQVLLTADDLMRRTQHSNAYRALDRLLNLGVVPVVNENDTVATHEIRFGDNDRLAALVAHLVRADALVLLSDVDALYDGPPSLGAKRIPLVTGPADLVGVTIGKAGKAGVGTGGMTTKVEAASIAAGSGIHALVTSTANAAAALAGEDVGTWFAINGNRKPVRLLWLAHLASVRGRLILDDGAVKAVRDRHTSLLPAGISSVQGDFEPGDPVEMVSADGTVIARGLVNYSAEELPRMLGRSTKELAKDLGRGYDRVVVHVDDLVLVQPSRSTKLGE